MRRSLCFVVASSFAFAFALTLVACESSDSGGGAAPDGGALPDGGSGGNDGGDAGSCPPAPTMVLEVNAGSLDVSGNEVVFMDHAAGVDFGSTKTKAVRKVKLDGSGDTTLYTATASHQINDVKTVGATVYFLESERDVNGNEATTVFAMPVAGGAPTAVGKHVDPTVGLDFDRVDAIVAVDADSIYLATAAPSGEGSLWKMLLAGGAETLVYRGSIGTKPQLAAGSFVFASGSVPSGITNFQSIVKVPATGGTPAAVSAAKCRGDVTATAFGILCAGSSETMTARKLSHWGLDGNGHTVVFELAEKSSHIVYIGPSDGAFVYVEPNARVGTGVPLSKAPIAGGPATVIACDRQEITRRKTTVLSGSNGVYVSELDMVMTATELVWVESRKVEGAPAKVAIYRTAK